MGIEALKWAFEQEDVPPAPRFVLVALANRADETGYCFPSIKWVKKKTGYADSNIRKYIGDLQAMGKLEKSHRRREDGGKSSNEYRLAIDQPCLKLGATPPPPAAGDTPPAAGGGTASSRRTPPPAAGGHKTKDLNEEVKEKKADSGVVGPPGVKKIIKPGSLTLKGYIAYCDEHGLKVIPEDDPVWDYAEKVGIAAEMIELAWREFRESYINDAKRQADWRGKFRVCVRRNWYKLWAVDDRKQVVITSAGRQAQNAHQAAA